MKKTTIFSINKKCQISINLDDGWCQQFCLDPYILGNWKVTEEIRNEKNMFLHYQSSGLFIWV